MPIRSVVEKNTHTNPAERNRNSSVRENDMAETHPIHWIAVGPTGAQ